MIYCVEAGELGFKIGHTSLGVADRIEALQTGCPVEIRSRWTVDGDRRLEAAIQRVLRSCVIRGEWFSRTALAAADRIATDHEFRDFAIRFSRSREHVRCGLCSLCDVATEAEFIAQCAEMPTGRLNKLLDSAKTFSRSIARGPGRPKIGRRRIVIVGDEQWNAWRAAAKREQTSVGEQIRRLMDEWAADQPKLHRNSG